MKKLTNNDIDKICDMALDSPTSFKSENPQEDAAEIKHFNNQVKELLKFARDIRNGRMGMFYPPEFV